MSVTSYPPRDTPIGASVDWWAAGIPVGWKEMDGLAWSRTTYAELFALWGTTYGAGDGSTTFGTPPVPGRVVVAMDSADTDWDTLGETRGAKTHALTTAELAVHAHTIAHTHDITTTTTYGGTASNPGGRLNGGPTNPPPVFAEQVMGGGTGYTNLVVTSGGTSTANSGNAGSGTAHNNIQPSIVAKKIVYTGV